MCRSQDKTPSGEAGSTRLITRSRAIPGPRSHLREWSISGRHGCTDSSIASEATWADRYRNANHRKDNYGRHRAMALRRPGNHRPGHEGRLLRPRAAAGRHACVHRCDKNACAIDKVAQFAAELETPGTDAEERLFALKPQKCSTLRFATFLNVFCISGHELRGPLGKLPVPSVKLRCYLFARWSRRVTI
jgi:hypothetical protein